MELGVSEDYAHKLATDRNMTDIKNLGHDEVASVLGISKDAEEFVTTMNIIAEQGSRRRAAKKSKKITRRKVDTKSLFEDCPEEVMADLMEDGFDLDQ